MDIPTPMRYGEVITSETTQGEKTMTCRYGRMCRYIITNIDDYNTMHQWMVHNNGDVNWNLPSTPNRPPLISGNDDHEAFEYDRVEYIVRIPGTLEWNAPVPGNMSVTVGGDGIVKLHNGHIVVTDHAHAHVVPKTPRGRLGIGVEAHDDATVTCDYDEIHDSPRMSIVVRTHDLSTWMVDGEDVEVYAGDDTHGHLRGATAHLDGNAEVVARGGVVYATDRASVWNDDEKTEIHRTRHDAGERIEFQRRYLR